jgi:hypothetical protein
MSMNKRTLSEARAAKARAFEVFAPKAKVVGVGITRVEQGYGVKINLESPSEHELPAEVDGVPIRVEVVGPVRKR